MQQLDPSTSPYHSWNLRRNPFGELTRGERAELAVVDELESWLEFLRHPRRALQFVGDCGHGKTTHLLALHRVLVGATYIYYPETGRRPPLPPQRPVLIDEAQRMGCWNQRRLFRGTGPIAIATHVDLSRKLRSAGFETRVIDMHRPLAAETLAKILNRRIEASQLDAHRRLLTIDLPLAESLVGKFRSDIRAVEAFLYDRLQSTISGDAPWPPVV